MIANAKINKSNEDIVKDKPKTFLNHCYPEGKGPDYELIESLEKEIL